MICRFFLQTVWNERPRMTSNNNTLLNQTCGCIGVAHFAGRVCCCWFQAKSFYNEMERIRIRGCLFWSSDRHVSVQWLSILIQRPTTYYLLRTTYYLLPTPHYLLPTTTAATTATTTTTTTTTTYSPTYYLLRTTYYLLPTYYLLRGASGCRKIRVERQTVDWNQHKQY